MEIVTSNSLLKVKLANIITLNRKSKEMITSNSLLGKISKSHYFKQEI